MCGIFLEATPIKTVVFFFTGLPLEETSAAIVTENCSSVVDDSLVIWWSKVRLMFAELGEFH